MDDEQTMTLADGTTVTATLADGQLFVRVATAADDDVPLIYTANGNVPYADLEHQVSWEFGDKHITCRLSAMRGQDVVRREPHVFLLEGLSAGGQSTLIN